jgi:predicted nucleic acid-binding protein
MDKNVSRVSDIEHFHWSLSVTEALRIIAATATAQNIPVATFDEDFRKFADVRVENQ